MKCLLIAAWIAVLVILHQDFWFWTDKTLVFGVLPIGLAYHAFFTVLAAATLFAFTKLFWPKHLDEEERNLGDGNGNGSGH